jgi:RHS repeat-associated protein
MRGLLLMTVLLMMALPAMAGKLQWQQRLTGADLATGSAMDPSEDVFPPPVGMYKYGQVTDRVTLGLDRRSLATGMVAFEVNVRVQIITTNPAFVSTSVVQDLRITYDPAKGTTDNDVMWVERSGGHIMVVRVLSATAKYGTLDIPMPDMVYLEGTVEMERYATLDWANPVSGIEHEFFADDGELEVRWAHEPGAEEYDLEWTFVSKENYSGSPSGLFYDFKNNATRVTVAQNSYRIPLLYEEGYVIYRIRAVGRQGPTLPSGAVDYRHRLEGVWSNLLYPDVVGSDGESGSLATLYSIWAPMNKHMFAWAGHERALNWQASVTFAEEGKRAMAISYHDGSLRGRQSVAKSTTEDMAVVGETFYDHQGRPAVQALPVPAFDPLIKYYDNFNKSQVTGLAYGRADFDLDYTGCEELARPFSPTSGAEYYYSGNSLAEYSSGPYAIGPTTQHRSAQWHTPQANGFPFVQTVWTPDPTGRVAKQGGAGFHHRLGSGHESKFFYGTPTQEELDRLFGSEVGFALHYRKNMSVDANGQVAVSYTDASGRTIATAMAGEAPASLLPLDDNEVRTDIREDMGSHAMVDAEEGVLLSVMDLLVTQAGLNKFEYELTGNRLSWTCESATPRCYDCIYDLEISVLDDCGEEQLAGGAVRYRVGGESLNSACEVNPLHVILPGTLPGEATPTTLEATLAVGHYTVYKRLKIAEDAVQFYLEDYLAHNTCLKTLEEFVEEEMALIDTTGCNLDCDDCDDPQHPYHLSDPVAFAAFCEENCEEDWCMALEMMVRGDVSPGGQYLKFEEKLGGLLGPVGSGMNLLTGSSGWVLINGAIGATDKPFQHPCTPYLDEDGTPSQVKDLSGAFVSPQDLTWDEFIRAWRPSWSTSLMCYHPDNCKLNYCQSLSASHDFDTEMQQLATYDEATAADLHDPLNGSAATSLDPYFSLSTRWGMMDSYLNDFVRDAYGNPVSAWEVAASIAQCPGSPIPCPTATYGANAATEDTEWKIFKSIYLSLKQEIEEAYFTGDASWDYCEAHVALPGSGGAWADHESRTDVAGGFEAVFGLTYTRPATTSWLNDLVNAVNAQLDDVCASHCAGYRDAWQMELQACIDACSLSTGTVDNLLDDLQGVCEAGCDYENPLGASTTPVGLSYYSPTALMSFTSFDQVISHYLPSPSCGAPCSTAVEWPLPYGTTLLSDGCGDAITANLIENPEFELGATSFGSDLTSFTTNCDEDCEVIGSPGTPCISSGTVGTTGKYTVAENAHCVSSAWEGKGYPVLGMSSKFLLVNSPATCSDGSSTLMPDPVTGVSCAPVTVWMQTMAITTSGMYKFSAEVMNLQATGVLGSGLASNPVLALEVTQGGKTWTIAGPTMIAKDPFHWHTLEGKVSFSSSSTATIRIVNYNVGANCNDFGVDHLQFGLLYDDCCVDCWELEEAMSAVTFETGGLYWDDPVFADSLVSYLHEVYGVITTPAEIDGAWQYCQHLLDPNEPQGGSASARRLPVLNPQSAWLNFQAMRVAADTLWENGQQPRECELQDVFGSDGLFKLVFLEAHTFPLLCPDPITITADPMPDPCVEQAINDALWNAEVRYEAYLDSVRADFVQRYKAKCLEVEERFERIHDEAEYQYTLYYYDQSGALVQTVPPAAVVPNDDPAFLAETEAYRQERSQHYNHPGHVWAHSPTDPAHGLPTEYAYNSLGGIRWNRTPDKGESRVWYDHLGRAVLSQDARQQASTPIQKYSRTEYDALGRVTLSYEMSSTTPSSDASLEESFVFGALPTATVRRDILHTDYDNLDGLIPPPGLTPQNLRNRVVRVTRTHLEGPDPDQSTWYSYDEHGNVKTMVQEIAALKPLGQGHKRMDYTYDLFSGNVHEAAYQRGRADQWLHRYTYDANNRLKVAETSRDGRVWDRDVKQWYYLHGPLARLELGTEQVQGMDYAGTILGWQKLLNSTSLVATRDMGGDGTLAGIGTGINHYTAKDAMGYEMGFFASDYESIKTYTLAVEKPISPVTGTALADIQNLYNGNIAWWVMNQPVDGGSGLVNKPLLKRYRYDQLNRIREQQVYEDPAAGSGTDLSTTNVWDNTTAVWTNGWKVTTTLDNNGNLLTLNRNANVVGGTFNMDQLTYHYTYDAGGKLLHNRLGHVDDAMTTPTMNNDLEDQSPDNYVYDAAGNLVQDVSEGTSGIVWDMFGKIRRVLRGGGGTGTGVELTFNYGTDGNRYEKRSLPVGSTEPLLEEERQYYVRDGSGNVMAIYKRSVVERPGKRGGTETWEELRVTEFHIYGGERVGILRDEQLLMARQVNPETGEGMEMQRMAPMDLATGERYLLLSEGRAHTPLATDSIQGAENHDGEFVVLRSEAPMAMGLDGLQLKVAGQQGTVSLTGDLLPGQWLVVARGDSALKDSLLQALGLDTLAADTQVVWQWQNVLGMTDSAGVVKLVWDVTGGQVLLDELRWGSAGTPAGAGESVLRETYAPMSAAWDANEWGAGGARLKNWLVANEAQPLDIGTPTRLGQHRRGLRMYELKDHLGNVHVVVSDRAFGVDADADLVADFFVADVLMSTDYYPYGSEMPGRVWNSPLYRYGFNGKEKDDDFNGEGNVYDYGFRVYDARLGRFLSVDPLAPEYPGLTPYQYASNTPIMAIDLDGLESLPVVEGFTLDEMDWRHPLAIAYHYLFAYPTSKEVAYKSSAKFNLTGINKSSYLFTMGFSHSFAQVASIPLDLLKMESKKSASFSKGGIKSLLPIMLDLTGGANAGQDFNSEYTSEYLMGMWDVFQNAHNGDEWSQGYLAGYIVQLVLMFRGAIKTIAPMPVEFVPKSPINISLGLSYEPGTSRPKVRLLKPFAEKTGAPHMDDWVKEGVLTPEEVSSGTFQDAFYKASERVLLSKGKIHFNLDHFDMKSARAQKGLDLSDPSVTYTNWEFNVILDNPALLQRTIFYIRGEVVPTSWVLEKAGNNP